MIYISVPEASSTLILQRGPRLTFVTERTAEKFPSEVYLLPSRFFLPFLSRVISSSNRSVYMSAAKLRKKAPQKHCDDWVCVCLCPCVYISLPGQGSEETPQWVHKCVTKYRNVFTVIENVFSKLNHNGRQTPWWGVARLFPERFKRRWV